MMRFNQILKKYRIHPAVILVFAVFAATALVVIFGDSGKIRMISASLWAVVIAIAWMLGSDSCIHRLELAQAGKKEKALVWILAAVLILGCIAPMDMVPTWNGEDLNHRDQYERMTESVLKGQLHLDYDIDPRLLAMKNPYDVSAREGADIDYEWDHAFYNGKYYMYFGVVPVFLIFLPYRLITGTALTTFHATQVFTGVGIIGMFVLLRLLAKVFFKKMRYATYLSMAVAMAALSLWYSSTTPSLYCTAISAAVMLMIWCAYFFVKSVYYDLLQPVTAYYSGGGSLDKQIWHAFCGSWCGALAFGCRPPVALANLLVIPLLCTFLKQHKLNGKLFGKLVFAASPYIIVAAGLMWYNYARFDNPFEFGQAYQLTNTDQSAYGDLAANFDLPRIFQGIYENFLSLGPRTDKFPYITFSGALVNFPILALSFAVCCPPVWKRIRENKLAGLVAMLFAVPLVITVIDVQWAPFLTERYRMDIYFVMAVLCFTAVGFWDSALKTEKSRLLLSRAVAVASFLTVLSCCVFWLIPNDANAAETFPEILNWAERILLLDYMN